ncbi:helix-turn-helix domain-containing protein [Streptomyces bacillaris]|uniref:helix-turn-helix domain-containing protein n=1 Tax=Streptomyces bacillaris TaxID=68179 RepID=UPI003700DBDC
MSVTPAAHAALTQAMDRLLTGEPQHSDGSLTVASLAREAGVSRATAYRATEALETFRQHVDERTSGVAPATKRSPTFVSLSTHSPSMSRP